MAKLSEILRERGYVYQHSSAKLEEITDGPARTLYLGIDPSADSLHVGQLQAFLILRHFLESGHKIILLVGGGTGIIGDPGGRDDERALLDRETVTRNGEKISLQAKHLLGSADFHLLDNAEWLGKLKMLDFLRDVGKHFSVNAMLQRDFVKERVKNADQGISYAEFSYALLQAYDYLYLNQKYGCDLQVGGSDQWGNIVSGVDFIRRKEGKTVYGLTWPLLVSKNTGKKFGKSEQGTVWLDSAKTTPFQFYQFLLNTEDESVQEYLLKMTMLSQAEIQAAMELHRRDKRERHAQKLLAREVTTLVHGAENAERIELVSQVLFGDSDINEMTDKDWELLASGAPNATVSIGMPIVDALVVSQLASSKREARQFIDDGAVNLNNALVKNAELALIDKSFKNGIALLKRGKRNVAVLRLD